MWCLRVSLSTEPIWFPFHCKSLEGVYLFWRRLHQKHPSLKNYLIIQLHIITFFYLRFNSTFLNLCMYYYIHLFVYLGIKNFKRKKYYHEENAQFFFFSSFIFIFRQNGQWAIYYTSPQSFIRAFSCSLA